MLSAQILGGKWKESAECVLKHAGVGGSVGMLPQENLILQPLRLLLVASERMMMTTF